MKGNEIHYFLPYCYYDKANKKIVVPKASEPCVSV